MLPVSSGTPLLLSVILSTSNNDILFSGELRKHDHLICAVACGKRERESIEKLGCFIKFYHGYQNDAPLRQRIIQIFRNKGKHLMKFRVDVMPANFCSVSTPVLFFCPTVRLKLNHQKDSF